MKDFLLNSTIPYWIVFGLVVSSAVIAGIHMLKNTVSRDSIRQVTLLSMIGTLLGLIIYSSVGGRATWWCTSSDYGFFGKLIRVIPLIVFMGIQLVQVFVYKMFVGQYYQKTLTIKGTFIALIVIVPASVFLYILLDALGMGEGLRNVIFYVIICSALIFGTMWAMKHNVQAIGKKHGGIFTLVTLVMAIGGLMSLMLLITALMALFLQVLMVAAVIIGGYYMLTRVMGPAMDLQSRTDLSGKVHKTEADRRIADAQIISRREKQ